MFFSFSVVFLSFNQGLKRMNNYYHWSWIFQSLVMVSKTVLWISLVYFVFKWKAYQCLLELLDLISITVFKKRGIIFWRKPSECMLKMILNILWMFHELTVIMKLLRILMTMNTNSKSDSVPQHSNTATTVQGNLSLNLRSKQNNFQFYAGVGNCHEVQFSSVGEFGFSSQRFWLKIVFFGTFYGYIYARLVAPAGRLKVSSTSLDFLFKRNDNECIFTFERGTVKRCCNFKDFLAELKSF